MRTHKTYMNMFATKFKKKLLLAAITSTMVSSIHAGPLQEGRKALSSQNYEKAMALLSPLADKGNVDALYILGTMYQNGAGVERDWQRAEWYYCAAAAKGNSEAQFQLGLYNLQYDNEMAQEWLELARANGHPQADFVIKNIIAGEYPDFC